MLANIHSFCKCPNKNSALGNNYDHTGFTRTHGTRGGNKNTNAFLQKENIKYTIEKLSLIFFFYKSDGALHPAFKKQVS